MVTVGWVEAPYWCCPPPADLPNRHKLLLCSAYKCAAPKPKVNEALLWVIGSLKISSLIQFARQSESTMLNLSKIVTDKFLKKGFTLVELPDLLNDLALLFKHSKRCTKNNINQELENLGWGIELLDEYLFKEIESLLISTGETFKQN
jgi:hypothetical protein